MQLYHMLVSSSFLMDVQKTFKVEGGHGSSESHRHIPHYIRQTVRNTYIVLEDDIIKIKYSLRLFHSSTTC